MKILIKIAVWAAVFMIVFAVRFPYESLLHKAMTQLEQKNGVQVSWQKAAVGLGTLQMKGLSVNIPSGSRFQADKASVSVISKGMEIKFAQNSLSDILKASLKDSGIESSMPAKFQNETGSASLKAFTSSKLSFESENLAVDTGSPSMKAIILSGYINIDKTEGKGEINLKVPYLKADGLPIPLTDIEIGCVTTMEPAASSSSKKKDKEDGSLSNQPLKIINKINLFNEQVTGQGVVVMTTSPTGASPSLDGDLEFKTKMLGTHKVRLTGTWANPEWNLAGAISE